MFRLVLGHATMYVMSLKIASHKTFYDICIIHFMETHQLRWHITYIVVLLFVSHVGYHVLKSSDSYKNTRHDSQKYQISHI